MGLRMKELMFVAAVIAMYRSELKSESCVIREWT